MGEEEEEDDEFLEELLESLDLGFFSENDEDGDGDDDDSDSDGASLTLSLSLPPTPAPVPPAPPTPPLVLVLVQIECDLCSVDGGTRSAGDDTNGGDNGCRSTCSDELAIVWGVEISVAMFPDNIASNAWIRDGDRRTDALCMCRISEIGGGAAQA